MKLGDLSLPISLEESRDLVLIFSPAIANRLAELHSEYGTNNCILVPQTLSDGKLMLSADVLTEIDSGGLLYPMWDAADKAILASEVEVIPLEEILPLFPSGI